MEQQSRLKNEQALSHEGQGVAPVTLSVLKAQYAAIRHNVECCKKLAADTARRVREFKKNLHA